MKRYPLGGISEAFSDRNFRFYSIGAMATWIGYFVQLIAVSWYAWELTHSTTWLAIVALLDLVPNIVLMPLAGAIADRYDKYYLMGFVSFLAFVQASVIAVLAYLDILTIWPFAFLVLFHGIIISFMVPAMYGILPRFVKRTCLSSAIAVSSSYAQLAVFIGPVIAGWVITAYGVIIAFALNALTYLVYLASWLCLKTPTDFISPKKSAGSLIQDIQNGFDYILSHKGISALLILLLTGDALGASLFYLAPAFVEEVLGMGVVGVSMILSAKGLGAMLAAVWIAYGGEKTATAQRLLLGYGAYIVSVMIIFAGGNIYLAILFFVILGFSVETYHTIMTSLIQLSVCEAQRGRVMGTLFMFAQLASAIGTYAIGFLATKHGIIFPTLSVAGLCLLVWLGYFLNRRRFFDCFKEQKSLGKT